MTKRSFAAAALVLLLAFVANAPAQIATTSLRGTVKDPSGAVIPGAKVILTNAANGQKFNATSDASGLYVFPTIPPAQYTITATANGFASQSKVAQLLVNQPATVNFQMTVNVNTTIVNVSAEAQTLNTTDASLGSSMGNTLIQALPSETRNIPDLLSLQPGVLYMPSNPGGPGASELNPTGDSRSGAVNGVRSDQGNVTDDGVDDNDQVYGYAFTGVLRETQDSTDEFRVATSNTNVDEGRSAGAQVSLITKSGSNKFHGALYEYNRPTRTVANDYFVKQAQLASGEPNIPGKLIRNIFGGDVGGPIMKDKLFFFANYEATRQAENSAVTETVATTSYLNGNLIYLGDTSGSANPTPVTLTAAQVTTLDGGCVSAGGCENAQYTPGPGPNPNALAYFASEPVANGDLTGDGYNTGSYTFSSPNPLSLNTSIVRLDFTPNEKHRIFVRGGLQKDTNDGVEQFPGQPPSYVLEDNTKGIIAGDTWSITPNLVNDIRYGYIRQAYANSGIADHQDYVDFRFMSTPTAETRTTIASVPVHNVVDNFNWNHGRHDFQFGANWRLIGQNRTSDAVSYNSGSTNPYWLYDYPPDPSAILGAPPVDGGFQNSWAIAYANLVGTVPSVTNVYNYKLTSATSGTLLADGTPLTRNFRAWNFEWYAQDAWKPKPNLTITLGIRHTLLETPYETHGQEVTPTVDTDTWYKERESAALKGQIYEPLLTFAPAGKYYGKPGFYPMSKDAFAPRLAFAYAPAPSWTIRAGAGIYYDNFGESLVNIFDQNGSFGLSGAVTDAANTYGNEDSPRFVDRHTLPFSNGTGASPQPYPYTPPSDPVEGFAITWGIDSKIKTPYTEAFNLSIQHEFNGWTLETDYVGTMGRHLLQSLDIAEPVDYVDPQGGGDYYHAGTILSRIADQHHQQYGVNGSGTGSVVNVPAIPYFEDVFPWMANYDYAGESATQAIYNNEWGPERVYLGATDALADLDFYGESTTPANWTPHFWQSQFSSLYALSGIGMSYYNAMQLTLSHPMGHGADLSIAYTFSKSIDEGSDAERSIEFSTSTALSSIINTWKPQLNRAASDFDTHQLLTVDGLLDLPFGHGRHYLANENRVAEFFLGGWQLSGLSRVSSGLPFSLFEPGWSTNWQQEGYGIVTGSVRVHKHFDASGDPLYFDNAQGINSGVYSGYPVRLPYPGETGERNFFRGDGLFDIDSGLNKTWGLSEYGSLKFDWEIYNVTNTTRFDPQSVGSGLTDANLGIASSEMSQPRRMQFALRYDF